MNEYLFLQQMVSFQHVTLESRNFIRLVSIKVMLKCTIFMENWIPVSEHWDDRRRATRMIRKGYWNDKKRRHWNDIVGVGVTGERATWITELE